MPACAIALVDLYIPQPIRRMTSRETPASATSDQVDIGLLQEPPAQASMAQRGIHAMASDDLSPTDPCSPPRWPGSWRCVPRPHAPTAARISPRRSSARSTASRSASPPARSSICRTRTRRSFRWAVAAQTIPTNSTPRPDSRKPKPEFFQLVASAGAIVFTIPKPDVLTGATRCIRRMGLLRGDTVRMRFRRLNMECTRTRTEAAIAITRGKDE